MKKNYLIMLITLTAVIAACSKDKDDSMVISEADRVFKYDSTCGECINALGEKGYNDFDLSQIVETKSAECMKFPQMHLVYVLDTTQITPFYEHGDNKIIGYNFKGADLDSTSIFFNQMEKCSYEGTKMSQIQHGYTMFYGRIDGYTQMPVPCHMLTADTVKCIQ